MYNIQRLGNSPIGLRDDEDADTIETYHPRMLISKQPEATNNTTNVNNKNNNESSKASKSRWLPRMSSVSSSNSQAKNNQNQADRKAKTLREKLSQKIARISSLDSTRSSSSIEVDSADSANLATTATNQKTMPLISITTSSAATSNSNQQQQQQHRDKEELRIQNPNQLRLEEYNNYYGRSRHGLAHDDDDDDDDYDEFEDPPLPIPYSSSSMSRSTIVRQQTGTGATTSEANNNNNSNNNYKYLLDDRQGMNDIEQQQFTKGEKAFAGSNRPSIDGSIVSDIKLDSLSVSCGTSSEKKANKKGSKSKRNSKKNRSKSPSSNSMLYGGNSSFRRQSRKGLLGLASRLKLTRKHKPIAKLQLSILNTGFLSLKTIDRDLQTFLPKERMTPKEFEDRVKLMRKYEVLASIEYRFASRYETYVCRHAQQESNQAKNNYKKCIPYDYNRVVLKTLPNVANSDYINASHVDSYLKPNAYIAAQGPNEFTIEDFWRMIWEQKTFVIVMLTKVFDFIRVMCNQYWPVELNKPERYGNLEVTLLYEEPLADFVIRTIKITRSKQGTTVTKENVDSKTNNDILNNEKVDNKTNNDRLSGKALNSDQDDLEDDDDEDDDDDDDDCSDASYEDVVVLNEEFDEKRAKSSEQNLPFVRAPKFASRPRSRQRRAQNGSDLGLTNNRCSSVERENSETPFYDLNDSPGGRQQQQTPNRSSSQPPPFRRRQLETNDDMVDQQQSSPGPNEFLHPLLNAQRNFLTNSASSVSSVPMTPMTPMSPSSLTPRTPSTAGLDRSSATRRAVKKKRRERVKNNRLMRTQFQVPDESQLLDDNDDSLNGAGDTNKSSERIIYQFHYNSWASHTCPFISSLLHFRRRVRICMDEMSKSGKTGPTIVHCNDGCGRTGTYLAIDANLELAEEDNVYDVFNYTKKMRQSRKFLIENLEQYKFVYDTIEEAMFCGKTWFPVSELHKRLKHKSQRNPITKKNEYFLEYEKITRMTSKFSIGDCAGGHRVENREKNRDVSTVPPDNFRPYLTSFQSNDNTDYINAVFVDGYTRSKEYIVTEWPSHKTICDFWSLVYDHDCNSVILLANPCESSTYPSFLPSEKELRRKFGPVFSAEMVSYTHYQNIKSWIYTINKKIVSLTEVIAGVKSEAKTTQVFQITCWPQGHRVPTSTNALVELMNMVERWRQRTAYGPVCVVSLNGKSRAGVYCAANVAIEQVVQHSEVDVFQAVKTVRRHRPQLIENMTEYKYCYDLILHYVLHYVNQTPSNN